MDETTKIQLGENRFVNAVNVDTTVKVELSSSKKPLTEFDARTILDVTELFNQERETVSVYRFHGELEYLSILNGIPASYTNTSDFFANYPTTATTKNLTTDLKFYLLKPIPSTGYTLSDNTTPSTGYTELITGTRYKKNYEVITELTDIDIINAGFARNVFNERQYAYIINKDIDLTDTYDGLDFPITELYLYVQYQPQGSETIQKKIYNSTGGTLGKLTFTPTTLNVGDIIEGDIIDYNKSQFTQTNVGRMEYFINTPATPSTLQWKYYPIIPITIRFLSDELKRVNISGTSIIDIESKPDYATKLDDDGNYVWRDLVDIGFIDPLTGEGVNHPFINNKHYVFNNIIVDIIPNLDDATTESVFNDIKFGANTSISNQPTTNLNSIGEVC